MASGSGGGAEPDPKRRRFLDAGGPIEDDETARRKMRDAWVYERGVDEIRFQFPIFDGFDPDNVNDVKKFDSKKTQDITPMGYFARRGDLPMMRWLYVNGADTRDVNVAIHFPMYSSAANGHNEACEWLFTHGAAKDIKRRTRETRPNYPNGRSPLYATFAFSNRRELSRWLILNGALCTDGDSGDLDVEIIQQDLCPRGHSWLVRERKSLLEWANKLHRARTSLFLFLSGTSRTHAASNRQSSSVVRLLSGKSGVLEMISNYTGVVRGREAHIIGHLTELLPKYI